MGRSNWLGVYTYSRERAGSIGAWGTVCLGDRVIDSDASRPMPTNGPTVSGHPGGDRL